MNPRYSPDVVSADYMLLKQTAQLDKSVDHLFHRNQILELPQKARYYFNFLYFLIRTHKLFVRREKVVTSNGQLND